MVVLWTPVSREAARTGGAFEQQREDVDAAMTLQAVHGSV